jgi:hypothetical protein
MKKVLTVMILMGLLIFSAPAISASAQKDIVVTGYVPLYKHKYAKGGVVTYLPKNAVVNYQAGGKVTFRGKTGYTPLTYYFAPVSSNGWVTAVTKRQVIALVSPGQGGGNYLNVNTVVRIKPGVNQKGYVRTAVFINKKWVWSRWIKPSDVVRVDGFSYGSIAEFHHM